MKHFAHSGGDILALSGDVIPPHIARSLHDDWRKQADHYAKAKQPYLSRIYRQLATDMRDAIEQAELWRRCA